MSNEGVTFLDFIRKVHEDNKQRLIVKHYGPGPHPGTGTPQSIHAGARQRKGTPKRMARKANPKTFTRRDGTHLSTEEIKLVEESNNFSAALEKQGRDKPVYYLTEKDLGKIKLGQYERTRKYLDAQKGKFGKGFGLKCRDAAVSAMKGHPEYMRGLGQGRFDKAVGLDYDEARPNSFFNLGYYRGFTDYKRDKRGGLKIKLPEGFSEK